MIESENWSWIFNETTAAAAAKVWHLDENVSPTTWPPQIKGISRTLKVYQKPRKAPKAAKKNRSKQRDQSSRQYGYGGGGNYQNYGAPNYNQPPVYYIPNHKEKDFSILLKIFLLAILIPLGIAIALVTITAFTYSFSLYGRYLYTIVNGTNTTYYFINGLSGLNGLYGLSGLYGLFGSSSSSAVAITQQQQQQQASNNNNNNNNANNNNNNNNANASGRANNMGHFYFPKPYQFEKLKDDPGVVVADEDLAIHDDY